jgi:hypothetical protein
MIRYFLAFVLAILAFYGNCSAQAVKAFMKQIRMEGIDVPSGILEMEDGWIIAGRTTTNFIYSSMDPKFGFMMKLDLKGKVIWKRFYGDTINWDIFGSDNIGSIYPSNCLYKLKDGNIALLGVSGFRGYGNALVMKCNPKYGDVIWTYRDTFPDHFGSTDMVEDEQGNIYLLNQRYFFNKLGYPCVFKISKDGKPQWISHLPQYDVNYGTHIILHGKEPVICLCLNDAQKDSIVMLKLDSLNGQPLKSWLLFKKKSDFNGPTSVLQLYKISTGYNVLIQNPEKSNKNLQLFTDTDFTVLNKRYIKPYDTLINPFYGEGYVFVRSPNLSYVYYSNNLNQIVASCNTPAYSSNDTIFEYTSQSRFGGIYYLGWVHTEGPTGWGDCDGKLDCKDIFFIKTDTSGRYDTGPKQPLVNELLLYPNPVQSSLTMKFELSNPSEVRVSLYDAIGKLMLILPEKTYEKGFQEIEIGINHIPSGIYTLIFNSNAINVTRTVLVE